MGRAAYSGQHNVIRQHAPGAKNFIQTTAHRPRPLSEAARARNRTKSKVRANVAHVFLGIKRIFGWSKVRDRGLAKNTTLALCQLRIGESVRGSSTHRAGAIGGSGSRHGVSESLKVDVLDKTLLHTLAPLRVTLLPTPSEDASV